MSMPCESTPRRSVRTMRPAVMTARSRGIFIAASASTRNAVRCGSVTTTAVSAMSTLLEARDLDPRVLQLVATVDGGQHGRDALDGAGVGEWSDVEGAQPHGAPELGDDVARVRVVAAAEQVALDRMIG